MIVKYTANDKCTIVDFAYQLNDSCYSFHCRSIHRVARNILQMNSERLLIWRSGFVSRAPNRRGDTSWSSIERILENTRSNELSMYNTWRIYISR